MSTRPSVLSDPASLASLQSRLKQREGISAATGAASYNYDTDGAAAAAAYNNNNTAAGINNSLLYTSGASRASPSVVASASQARSLRDRIYERTLSRSPLPPVVTGAAASTAAAASSAALGNYSAYKDIYAHEQPFPVQTVFEVQRVANPLPFEERPASVAVPTLRQSDTLLTDGESASLIRTLERKLIESAEALDAERGKSAALQARVAALEAEMAGHIRASEEARTRLTEAQVQCEAARQSIVVAVDKERAKFEEEYAAKEASLNATTSSQIRALTEELDMLKSSVSVKDNDQSSLFVLVSELQKAVREGAERQRKNADVIAKLDRELQESRTRAATVSTGFHAKDKQVRDAVCEKEALQQEVHALQGVRAELQKLRENFATLNAAHAEAQAELVPLRVTADEKGRLQQICGNMEHELAQKNEELTRLRGQVDIVRQQADQAFARSSNFRGAVDASHRSGSNPATNYSQLPASTTGPAPPVGAGDMSSYASLPMNNTAYGHNTNTNNLSDLQSAIRGVDAQVAADANAWKARQGH